MVITVNMKNILKNKFFYLVIFLFLVCIFFSITTIYLSIKLKKQNKDLSKFKKDSSNIQTEYSQLKIKLEEAIQNYEKLKKDYDNLLLDRENLASEIKKRDLDIGRIPTLEDKLKEAAVKETSYLEEIKSLREAEEKHKENIKQLTEIKNQLIKEKEQYKEELDKLRDTSQIPVLEKNIKSLQNVNIELENSLKKAESEIEKLKKQETQTLVKLKDEIKKYKENEVKLNLTISELKEKIKELNLKLADAVNTNKKLQQKLATDPAKFAEIARQNKTLIKNTANMHYNMGVFYLKQKDYNRAVVEFEKAIELTPDDAYSHFNLGYIYAEYLVNRKKAIEHFKKYLQYAKADDKDIDWVKKYILTWQAYDATEPIK